MLTPPVIADIRGIMAKALRCGIIEMGEVSSFARASVALEIEAKLAAERAPPPDNVVSLEK